MVWLAVTLGSVLAGALQTVTGFGSVVLMMIIFPFFFDMIDAPMLALSINMLYCTILCIKYRRDIDWRVTVPPTITYSLVAFAITGLVGDADLHVLVMVFAVFLMLLSLYFLLFASRVKAAPKPIVGVGCGAAAGVAAGLFAIGGPPIAPYFIAATKDHKKLCGQHAAHVRGDEYCQYRRAHHQRYFQLVAVALHRGGQRLHSCGFDAGRICGR